MRLLWQDGLILFALLMHFGAFTTTNFIVGSLQELTTYATNLERDPVMRWALNIDYAVFVLASLSYGAILTVYLYIRKSFFTGVVPLFILNMMVLTIFYAFSRDFLGNLGIYLRILSDMGVI